MYNRDNMTAVNYQFAGVQLYGGPRASNLLNISETHSFHLEYSSLACTVEIVDDVFAAIDHIHHHGRQIQVPLQNLCFDSLYHKHYNLKNLFLSFLFLQCSYWMHCCRRLWSRRSFLKSGWQVKVDFFFPATLFDPFLPVSSSKRY